MARETYLFIDWLAGWLAGWLAALLDDAQHEHDARAERSEEHRLQLEDAHLVRVRVRVRVRVGVRTAARGCSPG